MIWIFGGMKTKTHISLEWLTHAEISKEILLTIQLKTIDKKYQAALRKPERFVCFDFGFRTMTDRK